MSTPPGEVDLTAPAEGAPPGGDGAPGAPADPPAKGGVIGWLKRRGKWLLLFGGVLAVTGLIYESGPAQILAVLVGAGPLLPIIFFLEGLWISMDTLAIRALLGAHASKAPAKVYVRSGLVAFSVMVLLPAGRPGGEIARATQLGPYVGSARAGAAAARINGVTLVANALISVPCYFAIAQVVGFGDKLSIAVLVNMASTAFLGMCILIFTQRGVVGGLLAKYFRSMVKWGPAFDEALREMPAIPYRAIGLCTFGRLIQTVQHGLILYAVGGALTFTSGLVTQGIHLVGAAAGDMVPNQVGFNEGAYRLFAEVVGLGHDPARAVSIALMVRLGQFFLAGLSFAITSVWKKAEPEAAAPAGVEAKAGVGAGE